MFFNFLVSGAGCANSWGRAWSKCWARAGSDLIDLIHDTWVRRGLDSDKIFLRWLDRVLQGQYVPSLSIIYDANNKNLEKLPPQVY